ncbi:MAG: KH domain-containing protein [Candidatus Yanofskybacteria bacterium]|nr:KH domain-containing protein [Candidatus Yanofskybacteria bacterium]
MTEHDQKLTEIIKQLLDYMHVQCDVTVQKEALGEGTNLHAALASSDNVRFLIGKDGQNLKALEHIVRLMYARHTKDQLSVTLDINDYRRSKALQALELAKQAVDRVRNSQKAEALVPMSPYERRVVHLELASYSDITTESIGEEPQRRVVIKPFP